MPPVASSASSRYRPPSSRGLEPVTVSSSCDPVRFLSVAPGAVAHTSNAESGHPVVLPVPSTVEGDDDTGGDDSLVVVSEVGAGSLDGGGADDVVVECAVVLGSVTTLVSTGSPGSTRPVSPASAVLV